MSFYASQKGVFYGGDYSWVHASLYLETKKHKVYCGGISFYYAELPRCTDLYSLSSILCALSEPSTMGWDHSPTICRPAEFCEPAQRSYFLDLTAQYCCVHSGYRASRCAA